LSHNYTMAGDELARIEIGVLARAPGKLQGFTLLLPCTLSTMGIVLLVPIVPQMYAHFDAVPNADYLIQGGVLTMPALCIALFSTFAGWLADAVGRRRLLIGAVLVYSVVGIAPIFLDNLYAIIVSRIGVGLCEAAILTLSTTMIGDYFSGHARERWLASQTAVASISAVLLIILGGWLGSIFGWRGPFAVYASGFLFAIALIVCTWEIKGTAASKAAAQPRGPAFPWLHMAGVCGVTLLASVMFYSMQTQGGFAWNILGISDPARIGVLTSIASLGVPLGTFIFRGATKRLSTSPLLAIEFLILAIGFIGMGNSHDYRFYLLAASLNQIGCGMILPTLLIWAIRGLPFEIRGRGTGLWTAVFSIGQFGSGITMTYFAKILGGLLPAFSALGTVSVVAGVMAIGAHFHIRFSEAKQLQREEGPP
jgi:MFS family permease